MIYFYLLFMLEFMVRIHIDINTLQYILKEKEKQICTIKMFIKTSSGWILFKSSHKVDLCVYNTPEHCMFLL